MNTFKGKIIALAISVSALLGFLLKFEDQINDVSKRVQDHGFDKAAIETIYRVPVIRDWLGLRAVEDYHQTSVCLRGTSLMDLDRDHVSTDILVLYSQKNEINGCNKNDNPVTHALLLRGQGFNLQPIRSFNGIAGGTALFSTYAVGPLIFQEIISGASFPETQMYGFQNNRIEQIGIFHHVLGNASGEEEETPFFQYSPAPDGARVHVPDGYFEIKFSPLSRSYQTRQLDWNMIAPDDGHGVVLNIEDEDKPKFFANGGLLEVNSDHHASLAAQSLDRFYLDARCTVDGLTPVKSDLGAYTLGSSKSTRTITCTTRGETTYIDVSVSSTDDPFK
ncbi:hypothetical protein ACFQI9_06290 [Paraburkholderia dipogonis]|uniref:hypothetical protein n=1 Tax=Paraburkholderia dipogonis TaxID=1211383 RepID=UPI00361BDEE3